MENNTIVRRCDVPIGKMTQVQITYLINQYKPLILKIVKEFTSGNESYPHNEIFAMAQEGFYKAVRAYSSDRGKFGTYVYYYCRGWIRHCITVSYYPEENKVDYPMETIADQNQNLEDRLFIKEVLSRLEPQEAEIIDCYMNNISIKDAIDYFNLKKRFEYTKLLEKALKKVRKLHADICLY